MVKDIVSCFENGSKYEPFFEPFPLNENDSKNGSCFEPFSFNF